MHITLLGKDCDSIIYKYLNAYDISMLIRARFNRPLIVTQEFYMYCHKNKYTKLKEYLIKNSTYKPACGDFNNISEYNEYVRNDNFENKLRSQVIRTDNNDTTLNNYMMSMINYEDETEVLQNIKPDKDINTDVFSDENYVTDYIKSIAMDQENDKEFTIYNEYKIQPIVQLKIFPTIIGLADEEVENYDENDYLDILSDAEIDEDILQNGTEFYLNLHLV